MSIWRVVSARSPGRRCGVIPLLIGALVGVGSAAVSSESQVSEPVAPGFSSDLPGWQWIREDSTGWRVVDGGLQIRSDPGALAIDNENSNMPVREVPDGPFAVELTVDFTPESLYEQAGLVLYESDDDYVKLQFERVETGCGVTFTQERHGVFVDNGFLPLDHGPVRIRLEYRRGIVNAQARRLADTVWTGVGTTRLVSDTIRVGLVTGAGAEVAPRWVTYSDFELTSN